MCFMCIQFNIKLHFEENTQVGKTENKKGINHLEKHVNVHFNLANRLFSLHQVSSRHQQEATLKRSSY